MTEEEIAERRKKIKLWLIIGTIVSVVIFALIFMGFAAQVKNISG